LDAVEEGQHSSHGLVQLRRDFLIQAQVTEDSHKLRIMMDRNIMLPGGAHDLFGPSPLALGDNLGGGITLRIVT
jgi:hypothetical protein